MKPVVTAVVQVLRGVLGVLLARHADICVQFYDPVDLVACADYREYVQHPICLKDMEEKNEQGKFSAIDEFEDDLNLLHANCVSYCANRFDSIIEDCTNMMKVTTVYLCTARFMINPISL